MVLATCYLYGQNYRLKFTCQDNQIMTQILTAIMEYKLI